MPSEQNHRQPSALRVAEPERGIAARLRALVPDDVPLATGGRSAALQRDMMDDCSCSIPRAQHVPSVANVVPFWHVSFEKGIKQSSPVARPRGLRRFPVAICSNDK